MDIEKRNLFAAFAEIFPVNITVMLTCQRKGANNIQGTVSFKLPTLIRAVEFLWPSAVFIYAALVLTHEMGHRKGQLRFTVPMHCTREERPARKRKVQFTWLNVCGRPLDQ
jgi:hypothetical protein